MSRMKKKAGNICKRFLLAFVAILAACSVAWGVYVGDYYHATDSAIAALESGPGVTVSKIQGVGWAFEPAEAKAGLIFYPGGKVETASYAPLMRACAQEGILCVLTDMPFRLAVFDVDAAEGIPQRYPEIQHWYIGGHSLGGSMAAAYLEKHATEYDGLVLLASYSTADFSGSDLRALSLYGSEDGVLNREKYMENKQNLPAGLTEKEIAGGCHAYFGDYGAQKGDGAPTITAAEQIGIAAEQIAAFCEQSENAHSLTASPSNGQIAAFCEQSENGHSLAALPSSGQLAAFCAMRLFGTVSRWR